MEFVGIYRAKVLGTDSLETQKLGRIKVEVYPFLLSKDTANSIGLVNQGIDIANLPWAVPATSLFRGAGVGFGSFCVPEIGSSVWVFFEGGDVYQPVFFAEAPDTIQGLPTERLTSYPNKVVLKTKTGIVLSVVDLLGSEELKVVHPTGTTIIISPAGSISVQSTSDINLVSTGNINMNP